MSSPPPLRQPLPWGERTLRSPLRDTGKARPRYAEFVKQQLAEGGEKLLLLPASNKRGRRPKKWATGGGS